MFRCSPNIRAKTKSDRGETVLSFINTSAYIWREGVLALYRK